MFCTECGQRIIDGAKFCPSCGTRIVSPADPIENGAIFEKYDAQKSDVEGKAEWENERSDSSNERSSNIRQGIDYQKTERTRIHLEIPAAQGGGSFSCIVASRIYEGEGMKIWFESDNGEQISEKYASGGIVLCHANTIVCKSLGHLGVCRFILKYKDGSFSYVHKGPILLELEFRASDCIEQDARYKYSFRNEPSSESGFYLIKDDKKIISIDTLEEYSFSKKKIYHGMGLGGRLLVALVTGVIIPLVFVAFVSSLFGIEIGSGVLFIIGILLFIISFIFWSINDSNDYEIITTFNIIK